MNPRPLEGTTVFLDRDGVINRRIAGDYIRCWEQFRFLERAVDGLRRLRACGAKLIVVTNQKCVARGLVTRSAVDEIHALMRAALSAQEADVDAVYMCPDAAGPMRKPAPGMILQAAADDPSIRLDRAFMLGDSLGDMQAGAAAGVENVLVAHELDRPDVLEPCAQMRVPVAHAVSDLLEAARLIPLLVGNPASGGAFSDGRNGTAAEACQPMKTPV